MKRADEDPYKGIVDIHVKLAAAAGIQASVGIGQIESPPPNIVVLYNGMRLDKKFLYIDEYWLQGHERHTKGTIVSATQNRAGGGGDAEFASHNHDVNNDYTENIIMTDTWKEGDHVLLLPVLGDDKKTAEQYVVLCKLVRLDGN